MVKIGDAVSMNNPESETITPDDRQTLVQTMKGNVVQDFGYHSSGDKISWQLQFDAENFDKILKIWQSRQKVKIIDNVNHETNGRILVKSYSYVENFRRCVNADVEIWQI